jgi:hypothetical protein
MSSSEVLDREFLQMRAWMLDLAASLDRLDRAAGTVDSDPRTQRLRQALRVLSDSHGERAEQLQMLFSRQYDAQWRAALDI